ncbi:MAG: cysteine--tRNA ligase, partial [Burkholderia sp.]|nr:cysteine--tRNA ligase [Burkholderia sp.]
VRVLLGDRERARADKDWAQADRIRDALSAEGWRVEDTQEGQRLFGIAMGSTDTGSPPR